MSWPSRASKVTRNAALLPAQWPFCRAWISPLRRAAPRTHIRWRLACVSCSWNKHPAVSWVTSPYVVSRGWAYLSDWPACPRASTCAKANSSMQPGKPLATMGDLFILSLLIKWVCKCEGSRPVGTRPPGKMLPSLGGRSGHCKGQYLSRMFLDHVLRLTHMDSQTTHHTNDLNSFPKALVFSTQ